MPYDCFHRTFKSDIYKVKPVLNEALNYIKTNIPSLSREDEYELKLIYSELLFNAVIHGNKMNSDKDVRLTVEINGPTVASIIVDDGCGFDFDKLIHTFEENENLFGEHGRGIQLVVSLTEKLEYIPEGNMLKFYKKVSSNG